MKKAKDLVSYVKEKAAKDKTIYVLGAFGNNFTSAFLEQKCNQLTWNQENRGFLSGYVDKGYQAFDCVGLIKAFLWDDDPSNYKASEDENEVMMYDRAKVKGMIASMPERPGILVFMPGHVGVYIGNSYVVECTPNMPLGGWGVLKTKFAGRGWTKWAEYARISYEKTTSKPSNNKPANKPSNKKPDQYLTKDSKVEFVKKMRVEKYDAANDWIYSSVVGGWFSPSICKEVSAADGKKDQYFANTNAEFTIPGTFTVSKVDEANNLAYLKELGFWVKCGALIEVKEGK